QGCPRCHPSPPHLNRAPGPRPCSTSTPRPWHAASSVSEPTPAPFELVPPSLRLSRSRRRHAQPPVPMPVVRSRAVARPQTGSPCPRLSPSRTAQASPLTISLGGFQTPPDWQERGLPVKPGVAAGYVHCSATSFPLGHYSAWPTCAATTPERPSVAGDVHIGLSNPARRLSPAAG